MPLKLRTQLLLNLKELWRYSFMFLRNCLRLLYQGAPTALSLNKGNLGKMKILNVVVPRIVCRKVLSKWCFISAEKATKKIRELKVEKKNWFWSAVFKHKFGGVSPRLTTLTLLKLKKLGLCCIIFFSACTLAGPRRHIWRRKM